MGNNIDKKEAYILLHDALSELVLGGSFDDTLTSRLYVVQRLDSVLEFLEPESEKKDK